MNKMKRAWLLMISLMLLIAAFPAIGETAAALPPMTWDTYDPALEALGPLTLGMPEQEIKAQLAGVDGDFGTVGAIEAVGGHDRGGNFALQILAAEYAVGEGVADVRRPEKSGAAGLRLFARLVEDVGRIRAAAEREEAGFGLASGGGEQDEAKACRNRDVPNAVHGSAPDPR